MNSNNHESFQRIIDESLAGGIPAEMDQSLRHHLETCVACQEYLGASNRVIAGLGGFSFEVDPTLNARVFTALRAQKPQAAQPGRPRWVLATLAALALTMGGSFAELQFGGMIASVFDLQRTLVRQGVLAFWIAPSLLVLLLFPLLLLSSKAGTRRQERNL